MKKDVLIVKNIAHVNPGLISELLNQYEIKYNLIYELQHLSSSSSWGRFSHMRVCRFSLKEISQLGI